MCQIVLQIIDLDDNSSLTLVICCALTNPQLEQKTSMMVWLFNGISTILGY